MHERKRIVRSKQPSRRGGMEAEGGRTDGRGRRTEDGWPRTEGRKDEDENEDEDEDELKDLWLQGKASIRIAREDSPLAER
jgi:hypothetical protein